MPDQPTPAGGHALRQAGPSDPNNTCISAGYSARPCPRAQGTTNAWHMRVRPGRTTPTGGGPVPGRPRFPRRAHPESLNGLTDVGVHCESMDKGNEHQRAHPSAASGCCGCGSATKRTCSKPKGQTSTRDCQQYTSASQGPSPVAEGDSSFICCSGKKVGPHAAGQNNDDETSGGRIKMLLVWSRAGEDQGEL